MSSKVSSWILIALFSFAFVGFLDAVYLSVKALQNIAPPCFITGGCETVTTSPYSRILGIPIALLGALYYLTALGLGLWFLDKKDFRALRILPWISGAGFLFSLYLLFIQASVLEAFCSYCLLSSGTSTGVFLASLLARKHFMREAPPTTLPA